MYEYMGKRTPPDLVAFARGDRRLGSAGTVASTELLANVSETWLMLEALWPPIKMALTWAVGIAFGIKGLATGCLMLLQRGKTDKGRPRRRKAQASGQEAPEKEAGAEKVE